MVQAPSLFLDRQQVKAVKDVANALLICNSLFLVIIVQMMGSVDQPS